MYSADIYLISIKSHQVIERVDKIKAIRKAKLLKRPGSKDSKGSKEEHDKRVEEVDNFLCDELGIIITFEPTLPESECLTVIECFRHLSKCNESRKTQGKA